MNLPYPHSEDKFHNIYWPALETANNRTVIIKTIDIGRNKPIDYLKILTKTIHFLDIVQSEFIKNILLFSMSNFNLFSGICS